MKRDHGIHVLPFLICVKWEADSHGMVRAENLISVERLSFVRQEGGILKFSFPQILEDREQIVHIL